MNKEQALAVFEDYHIRRIFDEATETWFFSVIDVVSALTDSANPRDYWFKMKIRVRTEGGLELSTICRQFKMCAYEGKMRQTDCAHVEALLRIVQSIPSPKAEPFKQWLAKVGYERIQDMSDPARSLNRAREYWQQHGCSEKWIQQRMMGQETRNKLTDYWKTHEVSGGGETMSGKAETLIEYSQIVARFFYVTLLLVFCLVASASSLNKVSPEQGVWTGTIGGSKVMACFMRDDDPAHTNQSAYFYLRYSKPISLVPDPSNENSWFEGGIKNSTGVWSISVLHDRITGNWSSPTKTKSLPIQLTRFKSISSNHNSISSCSPELDVFNPAVYPQVLSEKIAYSDEKSLNGRRYRVISALDGAVKSVELIGESETIGLLNVLLANELRAGMLGYYGCPTIGERDSGKRGKKERPDYDSSIEPLFWNAQWISFVTRSSGYCGGAHPFSNHSYSTWNLMTGKELNPWEWIKYSKKADAHAEYDRYYFNYSTPERLNRIITQKAIKQRLAFNRKEASEENGCLDAIQDNSQYQIRLGRTGLMFTQVFPHVSQACADDIEITYGELMPFLTKKGKAAVEAIQEKSSQDAAR